MRRECARGGRGARIEAGARADGRDRFGRRRGAAVHPRRLAAQSSVATTLASREPGFVAIAVVGVLSTAGVGTFLALRRPANGVGWLLIALGLVWALSGLGDLYGSLWPARPRRRAPGGARGRITRRLHLAVDLRRPGADRRLLSRGASSLPHTPANRRRGDRRGALSSPRSGSPPTSGSNRRSRTTSRRSRLLGSGWQGVTLAGVVGLFAAVVGASVRRRAPVAPRTRRGAPAADLLRLRRAAACRPASASASPSTPGSAWECSWSTSRWRERSSCSRPPRPSPSSATGSTRSTGSSTALSSTAYSRRSSAPPSSSSWCRSRGSSRPSRTTRRRSPPPSPPSS